MSYALLFSCIIVAIISGVFLGVFIYGNFHESQPQNEEEENIIRMIRLLNGICVMNKDQRLKNYATTFLDPYQL